MGNEIKHLRDFRDDVPAATEAAKRQIHSFAVETSRRGPSWLPGWLAAGSARAVAVKPAPRRARRFGIALVVLVLTGAGAAITLTGTASGGQGVADLLAQVQTKFGDGRLLSASVDGSTLNVEVAAPDGPSQVRAHFETEMLASAVRASLSTSEGRIDFVQWTDPQRSGPGRGGRGAVADPTFPALARGACNAAARALLSAFEGHAPNVSLTVASVLTLPYAGGSCAFKFMTSDPAAFADSAPYVVGPLVEAMGAPDERAFLLEVDDQAGVPQFVDSWSSSAGGSTYIRPGLSLNFVGDAATDPKGPTDPSPAVGPTGVNGTR